jgi:hypothetical protein
MMTQGKAFLLSQVSRTWVFPFMVALCALLSGCTHENPYRAELAAPLNAYTETAVIILSTGSVKPCGSLATPTGLRIFSAKGPFMPSAALATVDINNPAAESEFSEHHGHLYVIPLPAGNYVLVPFAMNPYMNYFTPPRAEFEVHSHETVYLGELFMPECQEDSGMAVRDQETRDHALLTTKNPSFGDVPITKRLLRFTSRQPFLRSVLPF